MTKERSNALAGTCQSDSGTQTTLTVEIYGSLIDGTGNAARLLLLLLCCLFSLFARLLPVPINNYPLINCDRRDHSPQEAKGWLAASLPLGRCFLKGDTASLAREGPPHFF